jgi:hypothetical protein
MAYLFNEELIDAIKVKTGPDYFGIQFI